MGFADAFRNLRGMSFGGTPDPRGGVVGTAGSELAQAARIAASQPGLSRAEFEEAFLSMQRTVGFGSLTRQAQPKADFGRLYQTYRQLTSPTGAAPTSAEEVTSPEPEGPGRFQATRPGDLVPKGAASLRFGS